jgi:uncharacterized protein (TIGR03067 family)
MPHLTHSSAHATIPLAFHLPARRQTMRRTSLLLAGVLLGVVALGSDSPKEYNDATGQGSDLEDSWLIISNKFNGVEDLPFATSVTTYRGGYFSTRYRPGTETGGTYVVDTGPHPAHLDLVKKFDDGGRISQCIYRIEGDKLWIGFPQKGDDRPKNFDQKGIDICFYKRAKK